MLSMLMFWLLSQLPPPCDPLYCGMISFEELPTGTYTYLTWSADDVEVALMRNDFSEFWVDEFPGEKPAYWLERSAGPGGHFALQFIPPAGQVWLSVSRTGVGYGRPALRCYLEGRFIGGMISEWPDDGTAPQISNLSFTPGNVTFDQCILDLSDSDWWLDRIGVDRHLYDIPDRLFPRTKGAR